MHDDFEQTTLPKLNNPLRENVSPTSPEHSVTHVSGLDTQDVAELSCVDGPGSARFFSVILIIAGCGHVSGLFARHVTAGPDEVRLPGSFQTIGL